MGRENHSEFASVFVSEAQNKLRYRSKRMQLKQENSKTLTEKYSKLAADSF